MSVPINATALIQSGRVGVQGPNNNNTIRYFRPTWPNPGQPTTYQIDFPSVINQHVFGIPKSIFINNEGHSSPIEVQITGTGFIFTAPADTSGFYNIDAVESSSILMTNTIPAILYSGTHPFIAFYNFNVRPIIWNIGSIPVTSAPTAVLGENKLTAMNGGNPFAVRNVGAGYGSVSRITKNDNAAFTLFDDHLRNHTESTGILIYNDGPDDLYILFDTAFPLDPVPTINNFSDIIKGYTSYKVPFSYRGPITGLYPNWSATDVVRFSFLYQVDSL